MKLFILGVSQGVLLLRRELRFGWSLFLGALLLLFMSELSAGAIEGMWQIRWEAWGGVLQLWGGLFSLVGALIIAPGPGVGLSSMLLVTPLSRVSTMMVSYLALLFVLIAYGLGLLGVIQGLVWLYGGSWLTPWAWGLLVLRVLSWAVLGALVFALRSSCRRQVSLFAGVLLWYLGSVLQPSLEVLATAGRTIPSFVKALAACWDLQVFNLSPFDLSWSALMWSIAYGGLLITLLLVLSATVLQRRDLV